MNAAHLSLFHAIVRHGGLSKAARNLKQSQPNLSRTLRLLEAEVGEPLLIRSKSGTRLTPKGEQVFAWSKKQVELQQQIHAELSGEAPVCRIGASENLVIHAFPGILAGLSRARAARFSLSSGTAEQIESQIENLDVDVGFFYHPPRGSGLRRKAIGKVEFVVVLGRATPYRDRARLSEIPFVGSRFSDYSTPYFALKALQDRGIRPTQGIECNSQEAQLRMVVAGLGYGVVPRFMTVGREKELKIVDDLEIRADLFAVRKLENFGEKAEIYREIEQGLRKILVP